MFLCHLVSRGFAEECLKIARVEVLCDTLWCGSMTASYNSMCLSWALAVTGSYIFAIEKQNQKRKVFQTGSIILEWPSIELYIRCLWSSGRNTFFLLRRKIPKDANYSPISAASHVVNALPGCAQRSQPLPPVPPHAVAAPPPLRPVAGTARRPAAARPAATCWAAVAGRWHGHPMAWWAHVHPPVEVWDSEHPENLGSCPKGSQKKYENNPWRPPRDPKQGIY